MTKEKAKGKKDMKQFRGLLSSHSRYFHSDVSLSAFSFAGPGTPPPPNIRSGKEAQEHPAAPLIHEEVPDLAPSRLPPHFRPKYLLLVLPPGATFKRCSRV